MKIQKPINNIDPTLEEEVEFDGLWARISPDIEPVEEINEQKNKMAAPTKKEKFIKRNFEVQEQNGSFTFTPKYGVDYGSATIDNADSLKSACIALHDAIQDKEANKQGVKDNKRERELMKIANEFPTDKIDHGYIPFYAKHLPEEPASLLEIGCYKGNSIRMWDKFFPNTQVATLDLFEEHPIPEDLPYVDFFKGNQQDVEFLEMIAENDYEVVIDDGSHGAKDQWLVIDKFIRPGNLVIIEDLHCNAEEGGFWNQGLPFEETILGKIKGGDFPYKHELYLDKIVFISLV